MIDLTKPIEAVHPADGYVVPMELAHGGSGGLFYTTTSPEPYRASAVWKADGTNCFPGSSWTIRNVAEPEQPADWAIEEALKRVPETSWKLEDVRGLYASSIIPLFVKVAARMIQRYQPELEPKPPVDPDVAAVREILAAFCCTDGYPLEEDHYFLAAVEAFRRVKGGV